MRDLIFTRYLSSSVPGSSAENLQSQSVHRAELPYTESIASGCDARAVLSRVREHAWAGALRRVLQSGSDGRETPEKELAPSCTSRDRGVVSRSSEEASPWISSRVHMQVVVWTQIATSTAFHSACIRRALLVCFETLPLQVFLPLP